MVPYAIRRVGVGRAAYPASWGFGRSGDVASAQRLLLLATPERPAEPREASTMIEVENVSKRYGEKLAVDGLNFVV